MKRSKAVGFRNEESVQVGYKSLRFWRWMVYCSMFAGWSLIMLCRRTFSASIPSLIQESGFSKDDIGLIASSFALSYGLSKFVCAIVSDHISAKAMFSMGLLLSGICCVAFPLLQIVWVCVLVQFLTGLVQGFGWAPCAKLLKEWYPPSQTGRLWGVLSSAGNLASAFTPLIITYISMVTSWKLGFYLIGGVTLCSGFIVMATIKDSPVDIGVSSLQTSEKKVKVSGGSNGRWTDVFFFRDVWVACAIYALLYLIKTAVINWSLLYFLQEAGKSAAAAAACISIFQIGGMLGNLSFGYISDLFVTPTTVETKSPRSPVLFATSALLSLFLYLLATTVSESSSEMWLSTLMFFIGILVDGGVAVIGLTSMDVAPRRLAGSSHGLACGVAQVGGLAAGFPFAHAVEQYGWTLAFKLLLVASFIMVGLCVYLVLLLLRELASTKTHPKKAE